MERTKLIMVNYECCWVELDERSNSSLGFLLGVVFLIAGTIVAFIAVIGFLNARENERMIF